MKFTYPKLIPTLICVTVTGLLAATLPYPAFQSPIETLPSFQVDNSDDATPEAAKNDVVPRSTSDLLVEVQTVISDL
ncbi:MAG TPA: hypothetical protein IGS53_20790 [Leptolyngbyaceae cyanobacterium M33_DOE_097]|uniref:Uncharacterized protein n=1 Tax=Oscillatoriales cyanobacterium SpSt-418 TaxID=2282169 RepID=A0A7C3KH12_9CYAN|nr:hypothetical protein [Leptolyngbyaceae cyanobacterium M33_DOE_097]